MKLLRRKRDFALDLFWAICFSVCLAAILYKCRFGFGNIDESFYLTIPYRLYMGDGLFLHEYHLSQMSSVLIYPILKSYLWLVGSTEGMLLAFRYIFTVLHSLTALFLYCILRKKNPGAPFVSLLYLLYAPFGIMAFSYNSLGIALLCISAVLIYCNEGNSQLTAWIAGAAFSGAVLCCPYLLLVYLYYAIVVFAVSRYRKSFSNPAMHAFLHFTAACIVCAALFLAFVLSRCSLGQLLNALPEILNDPEHPPVSIRDLLYSYVNALITSNGLALPVCVCTAFVTGAAAVLRNKKRYSAVFLMAGLVLTAIYLTPFITDTLYINWLMFPMVIVGAVCFALFPKETAREFLICYVPGLLYGFCINWSSNQAFYVISHAALLSTIGSILMLTKALEALPVMTKVSARWVLPVSAWLLLSVLTLSVFSLRMDMTFWDSNLSDNVLTAQIEVGVNKGIYTDENKKNMYTNLYQDTEAVRKSAGESVLYFSQYTWLYLDDTKQNAAFSAWTSGVNELSSDRLVRYYERNPDKLPDIVYCGKQDYNADHSIVQYLLQLGYTVKENELSILIAKQ